jgi:3-methylcrotonyl-CoA carboxylase alpha subunit
MADEAVFIGASPASESYLVGKKIIEACLKTGAQAVHPGYGFLSENLAFCQLCKDANIEFIGPPPFAIRAMGSKSESKDIMIKAKVPVTPGYHGTDQSDSKLFSEAKKIGFPLMIKAVSGGGGKGMRAVFDEMQFQDALQACRREAKKSFDDDAVLLEKLIRAPRHVELQIFGDKLGNIVHLMERDCSVQRRHQKVLEEAPAPNLTPAMRKAMGDAAVACAKAVGYVGAGTVEFLVDSVTSDFYFCEMNTRLQVEHPVTEMITGVDLVEWQLRVAAGGALPLKQEEVNARVRGCAIEARIYAENPLNEFLPQTGHLAHLRTPAHVNTSGGEAEAGVRVDSGVRAGDNVSSFYDPMIAKLIVHGPDRPSALAKLERALRDYQVAGLANNIDFLVRIVQHPGFAKAQPTTAFFEQHMPELLASLKPESTTFLDKKVGLGLVALSESTRRSHSSSSASSGQGDVWNGKVIGSGWRQFGKSVTRHMHVQDSTRSETVTMESQQSGAGWKISTAGESSVYAVKSARCIRPSGFKGAAAEVWEVIAEVDGLRCVGTVSLFTNARKEKVVDVWIQGQTGKDASHAQFLVPAVDFAAKGDVSAGTPVVLAPMPGQIVKISVKTGDEVKKGDPIIILNAMKMEHVVTAPSTGVITILCSENASVADASVLAEVYAPPPPAPAAKS